MSDIIPFKRPEREGPYLAGEALCIGCRHQWAATAAVGVRHLECPSCGSMKGIFRNPVGADVGDSFFVCNCGCEALTAYLHERRFHLKCMSCGIDHTEAVFG